MMSTPNEEEINCNLAVNNTSMTYGNGMANKSSKIGANVYLVPLPIVTNDKPMRAKINEY